MIVLFLNFNQYNHVYRPAKLPGAVCVKGSCNSRKRRAAEVLNALHQCPEASESCIAAAFRK